MNNPDTETRAQRIIERLKMFNRKERDHLMKLALCKDPGKPELNSKIWHEVAGERALFPSSKRIVWGMDYHLNWLFAALKTAEHPGIDDHIHFDNRWGLGKRQLESIEPKITKKDGKISEVFKDRVPIQANQEDADLLIAWIDGNSGSSLHLTLVEAKLDSPWQPAQMKSKMQRLALIQAESYAMGQDWIDWKCLLLSPQKPNARDDSSIEKLNQEYLEILRKFSATAAPMSWEWKEWDGWSPKSGRRHVNRLKNGHSKWRVS